MYIDVLAAHFPLTKTFTKTPAGGYTVAPYPMAKAFTSNRHTVETLEQFETVIAQAASQNACLLKGMLRQQISNQSRAGLTNPAEATKWLLLDLDFDDDIGSVSDFLNNLDPAFSGVSYIFQQSSSAGITAAAGARGHIFLMLDRPVLPMVIKPWLQHLNLTHPMLKRRLQLSTNGQGLRWPLDITTCQNDKLIYVAPPVCEGFEDPIHNDRIKLVRRDTDYVSFPFNNLSTPATIAQLQADAIAELREAAGLPKRKARYKSVDNVEVLANPDEAIVSDVKIARGFVYLNLNGGDSWAYYFPEDKPELLFNFKDEPVVYLKDIAPDFYKQYVQIHKEHEAQQKEAEHQKELAARREARGSVRPLVFRDRTRDSYINAVYHEDEDRIELSKCSSLQRLQHFMMQYGEEPPGIIEDWDVVFDPTKLKVLDEDAKWINTFDPTQYLRQPLAAGNVTEIPPTINKVLDSLCVNDEETKSHLLNWLATIFQTRKKTGTAWVFHGVQGTGKGLFVSRILKPLLGPEHVVEVTTQTLEENFNALMERALILWIDEFKVDTGKQAVALLNKLKNWITEDRIVIRGMHQAPIMARSYLNIVIATNHADPVTIFEHDRRMNIAPSQEHPLRLTQSEVDAIESEVAAFAAYLQLYKASARKARQVLLNDARAQMIQASQTTIDHFFQATRNGELGFFLGFLEDKTPIQNALLYGEYERIVRGWAKRAQTQEAYDMPISDLHKAYVYVIGQGISPAKFYRMVTIHRLERWKEGVSIKGAKRRTVITVKWTADPEDLVSVLTDASGKPSLTVVNKEVTNNG